MKKLLLIIICLLSGLAGALAQYYTNENKIWAYGKYAGLDFTSGTPVPIRTGMGTGEGSACVCDIAGHLLFYTDGKVVFDRNGAVMPNGLNIVSWSTYSTTQAAVIVPVMSTTSQYYVFSLETEGVAGACRFAYSIVDMNLNRGLGSVLPTAIGVPIDSNMSEKMIAIPGSRCNIWLLLHRAGLRQFYAYNITPSGISAPVVSTFPSSTWGNHYGIGQMICSPDTRTVAVENNLSSNSGTELYSFDTATGIISNRVPLDTVSMHYGAEFSPDNSKLYTVSYNTAGNSVIEQYDVSLSSPAAIRASRDTIVFGATGLTTAMRLGPDGKIYLNSFIGDSSEYVDVINYPNLSGTACGYQHCAIALLNHTSGVLGMPSLFVSKPLNFVGTRRMDTTVCSGARIFPYGPAPGYLWFDGTTQSYDSVNVAGTYWVLEETGCDAISDSIHVALKPSPQPITGRNSVCRGNSIALSESVTGGVWSTGSPGIASVDGMGLVTGLAMGDAVISYSLADSCAATKEITVLPPCIDETEEPATSDFDVVLFPNPTRELCTISMSGPLPSDVSVYIYDVAGRLVHTYALSAAQTTVSVSDMAAGIYQCSIIATGQIIAHRKLVVVR